MNIGVTAWNLDNEKYYSATKDCISSVCYDCNKIVVIMHDTTDAARSRLQGEFPSVEMINNPTWGNNVAAAYNYLLERFFLSSDHALILSNDVVVMDGKFSWFNADEYRGRGIVSSVDKNLTPEIIFAAFIMFDWMYKIAGAWDTRVTACGGDHMYLSRLASRGYDIHGKLDYYGVKSFIIKHRRSLTLNDLRNPEVFKPGQFFYEMSKAGEKYYNDEMAKYKPK